MKGKVNSAGVFTREDYDLPASSGGKEVKARIEQLEEALQRKEQALSNLQGLDGLGARAANQSDATG